MTVSAACMHACMQIAVAPTYSICVGCCGNSSKSHKTKSGSANIDYHTVERNCGHTSTRTTGMIVRSLGFDKATFDCRHLELIGQQVTCTNMLLLAGDRLLLYFTRQQRHLLVYLPTADCIVC
jgi:hypothetical protein